MPAKRDERRKKVLDALNTARSMELHGIMQYMNQHYNLDDMDYGDLAAKMKLIAIDEMRHAELFAERIKELDGEPTSEPITKVTRGQTVEAVYPFDMGLEDDTIEKYNQFMQICRDNGDSQSARIFETVIEEEQVHFNYFDNTNDHVKKLGASFLSKVAGTPAEAGGAATGFIASTGGAAN